MMMTDQPWTACRLVIADVEGNGVRPPDLVELAIVPIVDGQVGEAVSWLVRPPSPIAWQATRVHGITNAQVADLPPVAAVTDDIRAHLGDGVLVAHAAHVDLDVLTRTLPGWQPPAVIDTLGLARRVLPDRKGRGQGYKLGDLVEAFDLAAGLPPGLRPHRAAYDALVTARLLVRLATEGGLTTLAELTGAPPTKPEVVTDALF